MWAGFDPQSEFGGLSPVAVSAATTTTATTAGRRALFTRAGLIHGQGAALEIFLVEHGDGLGRVLLRPHFDKGETPGAPGSAVKHDVDRDHRTRLREVILKIVLGCGEGKIPHE